MACWNHGVRISQLKKYTPASNCLTPIWRFITGCQETPGLRLSISISFSPHHFFHSLTLSLSSLKKMIVKSHNAPPLASICHRWRHIPTWAPTSRSLLTHTIAMYSFYLRSLYIIYTRAFFYHYLAAAWVWVLHTSGVRTGRREDGVFFQ